MICSNCGKQMGPEDRFCSRCGHARGDQGPAPGSDQPASAFRLPLQPLGSRSTILAFLIVAALGAAFYYYFWEPHTQKELKHGTPMEAVKIIPPGSTPTGSTPMGPAPTGPGPGFGGFVTPPDSACESGGSYFIEQFENTLQNEREMRRGTGYYDPAPPEDFIDVLIGHIRFVCRPEMGTNLPDSGSFAFDVHKDGTVSGTITLQTLVTSISGTISASGELTVHGKNEAVDFEMRGNIDKRTAGTGYITGKGKFQLTDSRTGAVSHCEGEWAALE